MASRSNPISSSVVAMEAAAFKRQTMSSGEIVATVYERCGFAPETPLSESFTRTRSAFYGNENGATEALERFIATDELPEFFYRYGDADVTYPGRR